MSKIMHKDIIVGIDIGVKKLNQTSHKDIAVGVDLDVTKMTYLIG